MQTRTIETSTHGRFLFEDRGPDRLLVGFHGYGETADVHLGELEKIGGIGRWSVASVQALHPFYTRSGQAAVASWMTSIDRELAIADNVAYVQRVLASLPRPATLVFIGFSQGASMAARAAAYSARANGLILLGGDIPPDVREDRGITLPPTLLARGETDDWYTDEKFKNDLRYLESTTNVTPLVFAGGHEWTDAFRGAAAAFLGAR
jgi:predicted esterase